MSPNVIWNHRLRLLMQLYRIDSSDMRIHDKLEVSSIRVMEYSFICTHYHVLLRSQSVWPGLEVGKNRIVPVWHLVPFPPYLPLPFPLFPFFLPCPFLSSFCIHYLSRCPLPSPAKKSESAVNLPTGSGRRTVSVAF